MTSGDSLMREVEGIQYIKKANLTHSPLALNSCMRWAVFNRIQVEHGPRDESVNAGLCLCEKHETRLLGSQSQI